MLSGGIAAVVGGCIAGQGIRDGTFVHAAAFYALVPLVGLMIGGQHRLPARLRRVGALLSALVMAGNTAAAPGRQLARAAHCAGRAAPDAVTAHAHTYSGHLWFEGSGARGRHRRLQ